MLRLARLPHVIDKAHDLPSHVGRHVAIPQIQQHGVDLLRPFPTERVQLLRGERDLPDDDREPEDAERDGRCGERALRRGPRLRVLT